MKIKRMLNVIQNSAGLDMSAILWCEQCDNISHYRQTLETKADHERAVAAMPCSVCAGLAMACDTCGE